MDTTFAMQSETSGKGTKARERDGLSGASTRSDTNRNIFRKYLSIGKANLKRYSKRRQEDKLILEDSISNYFKRRQLYCNRELSIKIL